jgi:hypothetical protein
MRQAEAKDQSAYPLNNLFNLRPGIESKEFRREIGSEFPFEQTVNVQLWEWLFPKSNKG